MNTQNETPTIAPPRLIQSFVSGFNAVATNVQLILFPLVLDLLLWFGPHLRLKNLLAPAVASMNDVLNQNATADFQQVLTLTSELWAETLDRFNLVSMLRTYPVGIPSMMAPLGPIETPVGAAPVLEINSLGNAIGAWLVFTLIGLLLGSLFFNLIARVIRDDHPHFSIGEVGWDALQILILTLLILLMIVLISIPITLVTTLLAIISPSLAQIGLLVISFLLIWLAIPFIFSAHGVFMFQYNAPTSILTSLRLVRFFLPGTGLFLLLGLLISQGLDMIWLIPPENSWMTLIGIAGHAFVSSGVLAASFVYYRGGIRWMNTKLASFHKVA